MQERESTPAEHAARPGLADLLRHPSITSRLRERWNRWEDLLAGAIAQDVGASLDDPQPKVVAAAITAAIRIAAAAAQKQPKERKQIAEQVFELLASGLGRYGAEIRGARRNSPRKR